MATPVRLTLDTDDISITELAHAITDFAEYLAELDTAVSGGRSLRFRLTGLQYQSPPVIEAVAEPRPGVKVDRSDRVVRMGIEGMARFEHRPEALDDFPDEALEKLRKLAARASNGIRAVLVEAPTLQREAGVTKQAVTHIDSVLNQGLSIGALEGSLDAVSFHQKPYFTIWDAVTDRAVHCYFPKRMRQDVLRNLEHKVLVHGVLRRDSKGRPKVMRDVDHVVPLGRSRHTVPLSELAGALAGDIDDSLRYLRDVRGE